MEKIVQLLAVKKDEPQDQDKPDETSTEDLENKFDAKFDYWSCLLLLIIMNKAFPTADELHFSNILRLQSWLIRN